MEIAMKPAEHVRVCARATTSDKVRKVTYVNKVYKYLLNKLKRCSATRKAISRHISVGNSLSIYMFLLQNVGSEKEDRPSFLSHLPLCFCRDKYDIFFLNPAST